MTGKHAQWETDLDIKKQVANILRIIESKNLTEKQLDALYTNAEAHPDLDETDRPAS